MQGRTMLDDVEMAYSRQIYMYNEQVIQGGMKPSLVNLCAEMASTLDDQVCVCVFSLLPNLQHIYILSCPKFTHFLGEFSEDIP